MGGGSVSQKEIDRPYQSPEPVSVNEAPPQVYNTGNQAMDSQLTGVEGMENAAPTGMQQLQDYLKKMRGQ
jgi:hypothetical protein